MTRVIPPKDPSSTCLRKRLWKVNFWQRFFRGRMLEITLEQPVSYGEATLHRFARETKL